MRVLACKINPFDMLQRIYFTDYETNEDILIACAEMTELGQVLTELAKSKKVTHIHLFGIKDYCIDIMDKLKELNIKIEVN